MRSSKARPSSVQDAAVEGVAEVVDGLGPAEANHGLYDRQHIIGPAVDLVGEQVLAILGGLPLGDVDEHVDGPDHLAPGVEQRGRIGGEGDARAVGPFGDGLGAADGLALAQRHGHRALVVRQGRAVEVVEFPGHAPGLAERGPAAGMLQMFLFCS
jgi:hypothetical protein